jgi:predicted ATPase/DNA-binding SARP family transcriptional activator
MTVRLHLFGPPRIEYEGEPVLLTFERRSQLLVLLALKRGWVGRADIAHMLWPEQEDKLAFANLRKILFRLNALPWGAHIEVQDGAVRFGAETDVFAFESALREGRVDEALPLYSGHFLEGFDRDGSEAWMGWLGFERERLQVAWRNAALDRLDGEMEAGAAVDLSTRLLQADPLDEAALRAHMAWLARAGQAARARQAYREFVTRLEQDLGLAPGAELKALHDSLGRQGRPVPAALTSETPDDGLVGRSVELRRIASLFEEQRCRLLTIVGPGGVGKTRVARRALRELGLSFPDGGYFVPLEDLPSVAQLGGRIARETGVDLGGGEPLVQVIDFIGGRKLLLVLDNFEQLAGDAGILQQLLDACPALHLIVTSRVRLGLASEWLLPLEGLPCPELEDSDRIEAFDAARLFIKAAQRVEPALIPQGEAAAIVEICREVEGLPLALELAAAWTRVLSCEAIAAELREGTELLRAVHGDHPPRHASIERVFEQSWRLLTPVERDALSRLSVFRGGFSAEAARAAAGASLPVLGALTDKSLLRKDGLRLFLHPLVHQFAALRLADSPARAKTEKAHAQHFQRLLAELRSGVERGEREPLRRLETEFENCRLAWRHAVKEQAADALRRTAPTLYHFCDHRGRIEEGRSLLQEAFDSKVATDDAGLGAFLLAAISHLEYRLDRYEAAAAAADRALAMSRAAAAHDACAQSLQVLGSCALRRGLYAEARNFYRRALDEAQAAADPRKVAVMLHNQALVEKALGHYDEALRLTMETLQRQQRLGDVAGEALSLNNLSLLCVHRNDYASARTHLTAGLAICERHGFPGIRALILANLLDLAMKTSDIEAAAAHAPAALEAAHSARNRTVESWVRLRLVRLALHRRDLVAARTELAASLRLAAAISNPALQLEALGGFAEILEAQGAEDCAALVLAFAAAHPSVAMPVRDDMLARLGGLAPRERAWPLMDLDTLVHRVILETGTAHAPLVALLRGAT